MDDWQKSLQAAIVPEASQPSMNHSADTALEIAFGYARSEVTYVLALMGTHKQKAAGVVAGDQVWLALGDARLSFAFDRKGQKITMHVPGQDEATLTFDAQKHAVVGSSGEPVDMRAKVRQAIDATVAVWKGTPAQLPGATGGAR
jgi:hypothetical protein